MMTAGAYGHPAGFPINHGIGWAARPFTHEEHSTFLDAMERYGQESSGNEWEKIAQAIGNNRTTAEVRMHAHDYFLNLQMVTQVEPDARVLGSKIKREDWTYEQDMVFEHAMAEFDENDPLRWLKVASLLPGKNHEDIRHRYERLIYDVHRLENGMPMEMKYKAPKAGKSLLAKVAAKSSTGRGRISSGREGVTHNPVGAPRGVIRGPRGRPMKSTMKTKIKGKGGGYLLSSAKSASSPRNRVVGSGAALKRDAAHLANLKRARVDGGTLDGTHRDKTGDSGGGGQGAGGNFESITRKSARARKPKSCDMDRTKIRNKNLEDVEPEDAEDDYEAYRVGPQFHRR